MMVRQILNQVMLTVQCLVDMIDMVNMDDIQLVQDYTVISDCCKIEVDCRCWQLRQVDLDIFDAFLELL
ncbi:hypothetical protein Tco_0369094 [Tanacetum coccineum]